MNNNKIVLFTCDFCQEDTNIEDAQIHLQRRPSDPTELVETLRTCPDCAEGYSWNDIEEIQESIEKNMSWNDQPTIFLTLDMWS